MEGGKDPGSRGSFEWNKLEPRRPVGAQTAALAYASAGGAEDTWPTRPTAPGSGTKNDDRSEKLLNLYRTLISVRKREPALRRGEFEVLSTHNEDSTVTYRRSHPGSADVLVALNNNVVGKPVSMPVSQFAPDGTKFRDELSGKVYTAKDGKILLPEIDGNYGAVLVRLSGTPAAAQPVSK
jgi:glycosidase